MKISLDNDPVPPLATTPREAGGLLIDKQHLVFIGCLAVPKHEVLIDELATRLPGPCRLLLLQEPVWRRTPDKKMNVMLTETFGHPAYAVSLHLTMSQTGSRLPYWC